MQLRKFANMLKPLEPQGMVSHFCRVTGLEEAQMLVGKRRNPSREALNARVTARVSAGWLLPDEAKACPYHAKPRAKKSRAGARVLATTEFNAVERPRASLVAFVQKLHHIHHFVPARIGPCKMLMLDYLRCKKSFCYIATALHSAAGIIPKERPYLHALASDGGSVMLLPVRAADGG